MTDREEATKLYHEGAELAKKYTNLRASLEIIRKNAEGQLIAQNAIGTPSDAPERINAAWVYTEANAALRDN